MNEVHIRIIFMIAVLMGMNLFSSCGSSDDEDKSRIDNGPDSQSSKYILKRTYSNGSSIWESTYAYDSESRVTKIAESRKSGNRTTSATKTYVYGGNTIISKNVGDWNDGEVHTFTLNDGLIVRNVEGAIGKNAYTYNYVYDDRGYIKSLSFADDSEFSVSGFMQFIWTDDNLTKIVKSLDSGIMTTTTISYSTIPWPRNWFQYWNGSNMDEELDPLGAWGKMPNYLPTKFTTTKSNGNNEEWTIDYTLENGDITKMVYKDSNGSDIEVYTLVWGEIPK